MTFPVLGMRIGESEKRGRSSLNARRLARAASGRPRAPIAGKTSFPARWLLEHLEQASVGGRQAMGAGFSGMLLGSVSSAVAHSVRIPVIVVRPSQSTGTGESNRRLRMNACASLLGGRTRPIWLAVTAGLGARDDSTPPSRGVPSMIKEIFASALPHDCRKHADDTLESTAAGDPYGSRSSLLGLPTGAHPDCDGDVSRRWAADTIHAADALTAALL